LLKKPLSLSSGSKPGDFFPSGAAVLEQPGSVSSSIVGRSGWVQHPGVGAITPIYPTLRIYPQAPEAQATNGLALAQLVDAERL